MYLASAPAARNRQIIIWTANRTYYTRGMKLKKLVNEVAGIADSFCVTKGGKFRLKDYDPGDTNGLKDKDKALRTLQQSVDLLSHFQEKLYAQDRWAMLIIFQAMDAAGKDGAIKHVMSGINPQGCSVTAFKVPSARGTGPRIFVART